MTTLSLDNLTTAVRAIGRASIFRFPGPFAFAAGGTDITLTYLGDTEGVVDVEHNSTYSDLTLPELTGDAIHERYHAGYNPRVTIPAYVADEAVYPIFSPVNAHGGTWRRRSVTEYGLAIIPEQTFIESNAQVSITYDKVNAWQVGGNAATSAQLNLLDVSIWFWRGHFEKITPKYQHADGGKAVKEVVYQAMFNTSMPDGAGLFTFGRPDQYSTPIHISST